MGLWWAGPEEVGVAAEREEVEEERTDPDVNLFLYCA